MNPQNPYQPQQPSPGQPGSGLPPLQQPAAPYNTQPPAQPQAPAPQPTYQQSQQPGGYQSYSSEYQRDQQFAQGYAPGQNTAPRVDYGNQASDQQQEQYSIDYLNKIAPKEQRTVNKFAVFGLIGGVLALVVFAFMIFSQSKGPDVNSSIPAIDARIQTLKSVTSTEQNHLTENALSEANASLSSALGTMDTDLQAIMKSRGLKKLSDKAATSSEKSYLTNLTNKFDGEYQKGTLDRNYAAQMTYELSLLRTQIARLKKLSTNSTLQSFTDSSLKSIDLTLKSYANYNATQAQS